MKEQGISIDGSMNPSEIEQMRKLLRGNEIFEATQKLFVGIKNWGRRHVDQTNRDDRMLLVASMVCLEQHINFYLLNLSGMLPSPPLPSHQTLISMAKQLTKLAAVQEEYRQRARMCANPHDIRIALQDVEQLGKIVGKFDQVLQTSMAAAALTVLECTILQFIINANAQEKVDIVSSIN